MRLPYISCIFLYLFSFALMGFVMGVFVLGGDALMGVGPILDSARMIVVAPIPILIALLLSEFGIEEKQGAPSQRRARLLRFSLLMLLMTVMGVWLCPSVLEGGTPEAERAIDFYTLASFIVAACVTWFRYAIWALSQEEKQAH